MQTSKTAKRKRDSSNLAALKEFLNGSRESLSDSEDEVHFVVDGDINSDDYKIKLSRKTYSKTNPIALSSSNTKKTNSVVTNGYPSSPAAYSANAVVKHIKRESSPLLIENSNPKKQRLSQSRRSSNGGPSDVVVVNGTSNSESDSDVELIEIPHFSLPSGNIRSPGGRKTPAVQTPLLNKLNSGEKAKSPRNGLPKISSDHLPMTNGEVRPSKKRPSSLLLSKKRDKLSGSSSGNSSWSDSSLPVDSCRQSPTAAQTASCQTTVQNRVRSFNWSSNGVSMAVMSCQQNGSAVEYSSSKSGSQGHSGGSSVHSKHMDSVSLFMPNIKLTEAQKRHGQELKGLCDNLNEISWAHDKSFKRLLTTDSGDQPSKDHCCRGATTGKNLRAIKQPNYFGSMKKAPHIKQEPGERDKPVQRARKVLAGSLSMRKKKLENRSQRSRLKAPGGRLKNSKPMSISQKAKGKDGPQKDKQSPQASPKKPQSNSQSPKPAQIKMGKVHVKVEKVTPDKPKQKLPKAKPKQDMPVLALPNSKTQPPSVKSLLTLPKLKCEISKASASSFQSKPSTSGLHLKPSSGKQSCPKPSMSKMTNKLVDKSDMQMKLQKMQSASVWNGKIPSGTKQINAMKETLYSALDQTESNKISEIFSEILQSYFKKNNSAPDAGADKSAKKKRQEDDSAKLTMRQSDGLFRFKEIVVKKMANYMQVILVPNDAKHNSLTLEALKELKELFLAAKKDPSCHAVLLNSSGSFFCTGLDLSYVTGTNKKTAVEEMTTVVRDLVLILASFSKPLVAAVNGTTVGFGVALLTYCDVVYASDKATFFVPATQLGHVPEGGITLTLPQVVGALVASEMLMQCRHLTAQQALCHGLVTEVLWPTSLMNEVIPRVQNIANQPTEAMESTKVLLRCNLFDKLKTHMERERRLLADQWMSSLCQVNMKRQLQVGWLD